MALILRDCRPVITSGLQEPSLDGRYEEVLTLKLDASPLVRCLRLVVSPEVHKRDILFVNTSCGVQKHSLQDQLELDNICM
jgi:hypothetical protein